MGFNSGFKGLNSVLFWISWFLKMVQIVGPEMSVRNYHYTLNNISEEHRFRLLRGGSLKSLTQTGLTSNPDLRRERSATSLLSHCSARLMRRHDVMYSPYWSWHIQLLPPPPPRFLHYGVEWKWKRKKDFDFPQLPPQKSNQTVSGRLCVSRES